MKTRSVKYYLMFAMLVILIGAYIGMTFLSTSSSYASDSETNNGSNIDDLPPLDPDEEDEDNNSSDVEIPCDPIELVNYALDIYNNGKGSKSSFVYEIKNSTVVAGTPASVTQYAVGNVLRNQNENLEECYFYYGNVFGGDFVAEKLHAGNFLKEGYRSIYTNEAEDSTIFAETPRANYKDRTYDASVGNKQTFTKNEAKERFVVVHSMEFPLKINERTCSVKDYNNRTSKTYNVVTLSYNLGKLPEEMNRYYRANSALGPVTYQSYEYEFTINKKTGKLAKMVRREKFISYIYADFATLTLSTNATFTQVFSAMDKVVDVDKPHENFN